MTSGASTAPRARSTSSSSLLAPLLSSIDQRHVHVLYDEPDDDASSTKGPHSVRLTFNHVAQYREGVSSYLIEYLNDRRYDYHHAFTADGSRLLTYDHEHFRVWDTQTFLELARLDVYDDMFYLYCADIAFIGESNDKFIAFFSDGQVIGGRIEEGENGDGRHQMKIVQTVRAKDMLDKDQVTENSTELKYLCCNETTAAFEYREVREESRLTMALLRFESETLRWLHIRLDEACQPGESHSTYLSQNSLLRIESICDFGWMKSRVRLWPIVDRAGEIEAADLEGIDGRFAFGGDIVITWDNIDDDGHHGATVYIYATKDVAHHCRFKDMESKPAPQKIYELDEGYVIYYAQLVPDPSGDGSRLVLLCDNPWSPTTVITVIDVDFKTHYMEIDTEFAYSESIEGHPAQERKWFHQNGPFVASPNGKWLFYGKPKTDIGTLYSLESRIPVCDVKQYSEHNPFDPAFSFDTTCRRITAQEEGGLMISSPPVLQDETATDIWPINVSGNVFRAIEFLRFYDKLTFDRFLSDDTNQEDILSSELFLWLTSKNTIDLLSEAIQTFGQDIVKLVVFSSDASYVAFVLEEDPVQIKIWSIADIKQTGTLLDGACLQAWSGENKLSANASSALFQQSASSNKETGFVLVNQIGPRVHFTFFDLDDVDTTETISLWIANPSQIYRMWQSTTDRFHILESDGIIHTFDLIKRNSCGRNVLSEKKNAESLKRASMDWNFVHIPSTKDPLVGDLVFGFDYGGRKLISAPEKDTSGPLRRNQRSLGSYSCGHVLWMSASRAIVHCTAERGIFKLTLIDRSGETATTLAEIYGDRLPKLSSNFKDLDEHSLRNSAIPKSPDELRAYCAYFLLAWREQKPDSRQLQMLDVKLDETRLEGYIACFRQNLLYQNPRSNTKALHIQAVTSEQGLLADQLFAYAEECKTNVTALWKDEDVLEWAMEERCSSCMAMALGALLNPSTPIAETANMFKIHLRQLILGSPHIFGKSLLDNQLCQTMGYFSVPVGMFDERRTGFMVETSSNVFRLTSNRQEAKWYWKRMSPSFGDALENAKGTRILAESKFVLIEDVAQVGTKGILRPMLVNYVPVELFAADLVKWTIQYKWEKFWKAQFVQNVIKYIGLLTAFSAYAVLLGLQHHDVGHHEHGEGHADDHDAFLENHEEKHLPTGPGSPIAIGSDVCLLIVNCISWFDVTAEYRQIKRYIKECPKRGLAYYFSHPWNWIELTSGVVLNLAIPILHILFEIRIENRCDVYRALAGIAALECIILWFKVLYYAQPFSSTGSLVTIIKKIFADITFFLFLALVVMIGFAFAFYLIFRALPDHDHPASFHNPGRSVETLFYACLGEFDLDVYHTNHRDNSISYLSTIMFSLYMMIETIVFLNLLIAIMGDTYDKVKLTEEAEILKCRAIVIDDCEAAMTDAEIEKMEPEIGKYLHVLIPGAKTVTNNAEDMLWQGRIHALESRIRGALTENEALVMNTLDGMQKRSADTRVELREEMGHMERRVQNKLTQQGNDIRDQIADLKSLLDSIIRQRR